MTQAAITTLTESEAVQKLAVTGQTLRRKQHQPAQVTGLADQLGDHLVANIAGYDGTDTATLRAAAEGAADVVAGVAAIVALKVD